MQHALLASKDMSATERELVRAIPEAELMNALLSKVKVMAQGDGGNGGKGKGKSSKGRK